MYSIIKLAFQMLEATPSCSYKLSKSHNFYSHPDDGYIVHLPKMLKDIFH